jgi:hypothetical protein
MPQGMGYSRTRFRSNFRRHAIEDYRCRSDGCFGMGLRVTPGVLVPMPHAISHAESQNQAFSRPDEVSIATENRCFIEKFSNPVGQISESLILISSALQPG